MIVLNYILYYLVIIPLSLLPFWAIYGLSNFVYLILYKVVGYRKAVVLGNIQRSFPNKTAAEHQAICDNFYRHFCDLVLESIKAFTISEKQIKKRVVFLNPEALDKYFNAGQSVIIAGGHFNNWELFAVAVDAEIKHHAVGIYKPLTNKFFDGKMRETRGRYGLEMISTKSVKSFFEQKQAIPSAVIFAIDQSPSNANSSYWTNFLNQDTAVLFGTEKYAKEYNQPVVFGRINKVKRGHYSFEIVPVIENSAATTYGEISEKVTRILEQDINANPEFWLWSHKRWKLKRPTKTN